MAQESDRASAFAEVVGDHYDGLVRRLTAIVRDPTEAQDLAQETYLRAHRSWHRFDGADARAWLHTIGIRLALNERKRRIRWRQTAGTDAVAAGWVAPADLDLHEALGQLRHEHRAALLLTLVDGYTQAEVAEMLDVQAGTVASWVSRAKAQMREALRDG